MKIIDAYWEKRNLGISAQEIEIEKDDSLTEIQEKLINLTADYQVIKTPVGRMDISKLLNDIGFSFSEALIKIFSDLKDTACDNITKRICDRISFSVMTTSEKRKMREQIRNGLFKQDRVSLDPEFSLKQSADRYLNWIDDEEKRGSELFSYGYKGEAIGFCMLKEVSPHVYYSVIGGVYNDVAIPFGSALTYRMAEYLREIKAKAVYTYVSSNNPMAVRAHSQYGYVIDEIKYVYIKHK